MADVSNEPRDPHGRWTRGAGGELPSKPDPRVLDVSGDEWNKQTAARLENEYTAARPALDKIAQSGSGYGASKLDWKVVPNPDGAGYMLKNAQGDYALKSEAGTNTPGKWASVEEAQNAIKDYGQTHDPYEHEALASAEDKAANIGKINDLSDALTSDETEALVGKYGTLYAASNAMYGKYPGGAKEDEIETHIPESWDDMSNEAQEMAFEKYQEQTHDEFLSSEQDNWQENDGPAEKAAAVAEDHDWKADWLSDYLEERAKEEDENGKPLPRIPYTAQELQDAIKIDFDRDSAMGYSLSHMQKVDQTEQTDKGQEGKFLGITFDDSKLQNPDTLVKDQMLLPGFKDNPEAMLTKEMRNDIEDKLREAFWDAADKKDIEPPDYLEDSVKEYQQQFWDEMGDKEKFNWIKKNTDMLDEETVQAKAEEAAQPITIPKTFDPMNETSGKDYQETQRLAKYMADQRAIQLMNERGLKSGGGTLDPWFAQYSLAELKDFMADPDEAMKLSGFKTETSQKMWLKNLSDEIKFREDQQPVSLANIQSVDNKLWSGWKGSSSGTEGRILQVAAADELGGRLRAQLKPGEQVSKYEAKEAWQDAGYANPMEYASAKGVTLGEAHELVPQTHIPAEKYQNWEASGKPVPVVDGMAGPGSLHTATTSGQTGTVNIHSGDLIYHDPTIQKFLPVLTGTDEANEIGKIIDKYGFGTVAPGTLQIAWGKLNDAQKYAVANGFYDNHQADPAFKNINQPPPNFGASGPQVLRGETVNTGEHYEVKLPGSYVGGSSVSNYATEKEAIDYLNENYPEWKQKGWEITKKEGTGEGHEYTRLPELNVQRNGAASMTTDPKIANGWGGTPVKASQITREEAIKDANTMFPTIGGYEGVKAAIRAKWETTQYLLDKADMPVVQLYRGISMPHSIAGDTMGTYFPSPQYPTGKHDGPDMEVVENGQKKMVPYIGMGADETHPLLWHPQLNSYVGPEHKDYAQLQTVPMITQGSNVKIMSGPGNEPTKITQGPKIERVVLRAEVPRTAVLSVPAYGINAHSEHEVVVTGTGWKGWDAWSSKAPTFGEVPMAETTPSSYADKPQTTKDWAAIEQASDKAYNPDIKITLTPEQAAFLAKYKANKGEQ